MKKAIKTIIAIGMATLTMFSATSVFAAVYAYPYENGWYQTNNEWHYSVNGKDLRSTEAVINGKKYYFYNNGVMAHNSFVMYRLRNKETEPLKTCYAGSSGAFVKGWVQPKASKGWWYFDTNYEMHKGWLKYKGDWYYLGNGGAMVTGWQKIGKTWYYFESSGKMRTSNLVYKGKTYRFNSSGACINP